MGVSAEDQLKELKRGCEDILLEDELLKKLLNSIKNNKPLVVKLGADPSRPDIHLGHSVVLNKLKLLQEFGHQIVFIIGDFTAMIGDPTGRNKARPPLTKEEVAINSKTYQEQVFKILDPKKTKVVLNSQWLGKLEPMDFVKLLATQTVQQMIARDDFSKRYQENKPIFVHELLYPVLQAYDSVYLKADIEFGGSDQRFNLLLGRELQKSWGQAPQSLVIMPLLEGLDGVQKMSKSLDNYIGLTDAPQDMFGKVMSISDKHMLRFYDLLSNKNLSQIDEIKKDLQEQKLHPMKAKKSLAKEITATYWGEKNAEQALDDFTKRFSQKKLPDDIKDHVVKLDDTGSLSIVEISCALGFSKSKSEARRVLKQNGMKLDDKTILEEKLTLTLGTYIFRQGKLKIVRIIVS
jgi:tyrosyl-tRNA synthetase